MQPPEPGPADKMNRREVVFIDDDRRLIEHFAEAVRSAGFKVHVFHGPDQALAYLGRSNTESIIVVWDMMMAPGKIFRDEDNELGLSTGRLLYPRMRALHPDCHYILFTARGDESFSEFDSPCSRSHVRYKTQLSATDLAELLVELVDGG